MTKIKFYIFYSLITLLTVTENAFANTDGYYFDASLTSNDVSHDVSITDLGVAGGNRVQSTNLQGNTILFTHSLNKNKEGVAFKIGKKITFDNSKIFISPALSYEYLNNSVKDSNNFEYTINNRIIADLSLGYNINKKLSTYISYGISDVGYRVDTNANGNYEAGLTGNSVAQDLGTYKNRNSSNIIGLGVRYKATNNLFVLVEYSKQKIDLNSEHDALLGGVTSVQNKSKIETFKIGISKNL